MRRGWRFTLHFIIGRLSQFGTNNDKNWTKTLLLRRIVLKPAWPTRAHSQAQVSSPPSWSRKLKLAEAMAIDPAKSTLPEPEGELQFVPLNVDLDSETAAALQRRADLKLARLFVRAANEDQRIIAADY